MDIMLQHFGEAIYHFITSPLYMLLTGFAVGIIFGKNKKD